VFRRALPVVSVAAVALLAAGCGGGQSRAGPILGAGGAAEIPASAALVVSVDTSFGSKATDELRALLDRFPAKGQLYGAIRRELAKEGLDFDADVRPAFGPETDLVLLDLAASEPDYVLLTQPEDPAKLDALLAKAPEPEPIVHEVLDGWTVAADSAETIAAFRDAAAANGALAASDTYREATSDLPEDALATLYVNGAPAMEALAKRGTTTIPRFGRLAWISGALQAQDGGVSFDLHAKGDDVTVTPYSARLASTAPARSLAFVSFNALGDALKGIAQQPPLGDIADLLGGEGAVYVRAGAPLEVTALLDESNPVDAVARVDELVRRFGGLIPYFPVQSGWSAYAPGPRPQETHIGGVSARRVSLYGASLNYAAVGGQLVVTTSEQGIRELAPLAPKFSSDPVFRSARDTAGMPDETTGFAFVNLQDTIPLVEGLTTSTIPPEVAENLKPLQAFLAFGTLDGDTLSVHLFVQVS